MFKIIYLILKGYEKVLKCFSEFPLTLMSRMKQKIPKNSFSLSLFSTWTRDALTWPKPLEDWVLSSVFYLYWWCLDWTPSSGRLKSLKWLPFCDDFWNKEHTYHDQSTETWLGVIKLLSGSCSLFFPKLGFALCSKVQNTVNQT